jgi:hypothetical protein
MRAAAPDPRVKDRVDDEDAQSQHELQLARQASRIDQRQQVVFDEAFAVTGLPGQQAQADLQPGQRAVRARRLDRHAPAGRREVQRQPAAPARHQQCTGHDEQDEAEMQQQDRIGKGAVSHADMLQQYYPQGYALGIAQADATIARCGVGARPALAYIVI